MGVVESGSEISADELLSHIEYEDFAYVDFVLEQAIFEGNHFDVAMSFAETALRHDDPRARESSARFFEKAINEGMIEPSDEQLQALRAGLGDSEDYARFAFACALSASGDSSTEVMSALRQPPNESWHQAISQGYLEQFTQEYAAV